MKIGVIIHSQTGNTYNVALRLEEKLLSYGHSVNVEKLEPVGSEQVYEKDVSKIWLQKLPYAGTYDAVIFGGPVRGASISPVLAAYLTQSGPLEGKKAACFVTEFFPYPWMGGNRAITQMKRLCESKGAVVCGTGIVNWMGRQREKRINDVVDKLCSLFC